MSQHPGILSSLDLSRIGSTEQGIIRKLARIWFITFARRATFKKSDFTFVFAKPTDKLREGFHFGREVLVLFTPYHTFEPRALDFVDKTIFEFQNRLDKLCVIIISQDLAISHKIRQIVMQDKESRLLIPYSYSELASVASGDDALIISRLKEFFYERDLFAFDSPLRSDTYFFGRTQTIQYLYGKYKSGENGCLFGLRKIGKTSALFAVKRYLELREEPVVFVDCAEPAFHQRRWYNALYFLVDSLARTLAASGKIILAQEQSYDEKTASQLFEDDLRKLQGQLGGKRLLFILDEIENITFDISPTDHWANGKDYIYFWQSVRSVFQKNPDLYSFIIAGVNPKAVETTSVQGYDNPIYRFVTPLYLSLFTVNEVKEMVSSIGNYMGLEFEDEVFTYLADDYGGHPFLIRQVCSRIHRSISQPRPCPVTKFRYQQDRDKLSQYIQDYIGLIVSVLRERYKHEYELLQSLAQGDEKTFSDFARMSHSMIEHLEGYGLIKEDSGKYHFRVRAVQNYIRDRLRVAKVLTTKEDKWREVTTQRNRFESDLRKVLKLTLKLQFGLTEAKDAFLKIVTPDREAKLAVLNLDEIFESEIYLEDLRKIIIRNWDKLGRLFNNDRDHFQTYMEYVNKHRIDAHAREIDEDTLGLVLIALEWLQRQVSNYL